MMKKLQILVLLILSATLINAQMLISGVFDGPLSDGTPKTVEFYVYEDIADLSAYGFGSANNGGGSDGEEFSFPAESVTAGTFLYVATEIPKFNEFFGFNPDYIAGGATSINGDDAIELFKNNTVVDVFGDINVDGTGKAWEYLDGWAYRKNSTGPDQSTFVEANWTYSGKNALDGESTNATADTPFPISTYTKGSVTIPVAPVATIATNITDVSFVANWNASSSATKYFLDVSTESDFSTFLAEYEDKDVGNSTNLSVANLSAVTNYYYRVRANNSAGTSGNSNIISVTTLPQAVTSVEFKSSEGSVAETAGNYNIQISIANPDGTIATSADVVLISGDASDLDNYTTQSVSFPAGSNSDQNVAISITDDGISEGNESFTFELQNISGGNSAIIGSTSQFTLTVIESSSSDYYVNIDPNKSSFIDDLKQRIRLPYTHVYYSQFDETNIANFAAIDNGNGSKSVFCVYSNYEYVYTGTFSWLPLSREHTFPHSWMPTNPANNPERDEYSDQHHLFPTHQNEANAVRSNHPLGNVANTSSTFYESKFGTDENGNTVFEPRDEHKGDAARAILYMTVRYDDIDGDDWGLNWVNSNSGKDPQDLAVLLAWHEQDPPNQKEIERNDYIESIQGNRNPFVDHPEYVNYIDFYEIEYISNGLFFTEYIEGSSNSKALELFNNTGSNVDLSTENYNIKIYANGSTTASYNIELNGSIADGATFVVANPSSDQAILNVADQTTNSVNFNGDDAIVLLRGNDVVDVIGQIGVDPGEEWGIGDISTKDNTIRRKSSINVGDSDGSDVFDPSVEWLGYSINTFDGLGSHTINAGPPAIANVTRLPKIPQASENTTVTTEVTDDTGVSVVKLKYSIDGGSVQEIPMANTAGSEYQSILPNSIYSDGSLLEYWVYAEDYESAFSNGTKQKVFIGITPIENLHTIDSDGRLLHLQTYARIKGVATVESGIFSSSSLDVYLQDATGGINLYKSGSASTVIVRGNNYQVAGRIEQYNGKTEIVPDNASTDVTDGGIGVLPKVAKVNGAGVLPDPFVNSMAGFLGNAEQYEGMLVGIQHITNTGNGDAWPSASSNSNVEITDDGGTSLLTLRVDKDTEIDGSPEPSWPKDVVGILTQFDGAAPYADGYQILPRDLNDIQNDGALPVELSTFSVTILESGISLLWETATEVNNFGFDIERKPQTGKWSNIGFINGHGNSNSTKKYSYVDNSVSISGKYVYRLKQIDIDGKYEYSNEIEVEVGVPNKFSVAQNYPNPFNPSTTLSFTIPKKENVSVVIFNMLGEAVNVVVDEILEAGNYKYNFDASKLGSGIYFYRVSAGKNVEVRKMTLIK